MPRKRRSSKAPEMSHNKRSQTPEHQWEQALLDAYHDYRWRQVKNHVTFGWNHVILLSYIV